MQIRDNENCILSFRELEIYESDIDILIDEYITKIGSVDMLYKSNGFSGLLELIYKRIIKNIFPKNEQYDFKLLDNIFYNVYLPLCYRFNNNPTIIQFCTLCHIDSNNITDIKNGIYRTDGGKVRLDKTLTVKKWYTVCESGLLSKTINESSIGSMFALKALYGYRDNTTLTIESGNTQQHETAEQIAERHKNAQIPIKPDL